ncbi:MAG: sigma-70 family RNA polymerase sigma factor, partial [Acidobacteriota bacterium]
ELWEQFIERFQNRLHAGVYRALARCELELNRQDREDLMQDVFCRLLDRRRRCLKLCRGREEASVGAYLGRVAENVVLDRVRSTSAVKRGRDRLVELRPESVYDPVADAADRRSNPEARLLAREREWTFLASFRQVVGRTTPERDWRVFYLAVFEGCSSREICTRMGGSLKPSTVDSLIHRMRRRLAAKGMKIPRRNPSGPLQDDSRDSTRSR